MSELEALRKRLEQEPDNLSLRVTIAGHLRDAGRDAEAIELYRSVALAYRGQGRSQQAVAVCRSILELAPEDPGCLALLAELARPPRGESQHDRPGSAAEPTVTAAGSQVEPARPARARPRPARDSILPHDVTTPLPRPVPYHVHDPTLSVDRISRVDDDLPAVEGADTRPGDEDRSSDTTGLAEAARRISGLIARDTLPLSRGSVVRLSAGEVESDTHEAVPGATAARDSEPTRDPLAPHDFDEAPTPAPHRPREPIEPSARDTDEDLTAPRELVAAEPLENAFFVALPASARDAALRRCAERMLAAGAPAIRAGEASHALVLVVSGRLEVRLDRAAGALTLEVVEPGQYVGEASLLARGPAPAAVVAAVDSVVLALPPHALFELAGAYPALWAALKDSAERRARRYDRLIRASP